ncbi:hypothetical protein J2S21_000684 [Peribacillus cavernae]|nr:hypothetical protein [Peribacillus cavernae]
MPKDSNQIKKHLVQSFTVFARADEDSKGLGALQGVLLRYSKTNDEEPTIQLESLRRSTGEVSKTLHSNGIQVGIPHFKRTKPVSGGSSMDSCFFFR